MNGKEGEKNLGGNMKKCKREAKSEKAVAVGERSAESDVRRLEMPV